MTFKEGLAHLQKRAVTMRGKTPTNTLRWTKGDVAAVEAIVAGVALAVRRSEARAAQPHVEERHPGSPLRRAM